MDIWFDMDGTITDLYADKDWLPKLTAHDPTPYANAKPLLNMQALARVLNRLVKEGHTINVISWLAKNSNEQYDREVEAIKRNWLKTHLASVQFTQIDIVAYGTPKHENRNGILFDDEEKNRLAWGEGAYNTDNIIEILKSI